jgi:hypothetical protein
VDVVSILADSFGSHACLLPNHFQGNAKAICESILNPDPFRFTADNCLNLAHALAIDVAKRRQNTQETFLSLRSLNLPKL